jgi:hypothetical protein
MFEQYLGRRQREAYADPGTREGWDLWLERVLAAYGEDDPREVDIAIIDGQLPLTAETAGTIYADFTPPKPTYARGDRPALEAVVDATVAADMPDRQKALALMRRCRDNGRHGQIPQDSFWGGSEEDLLRRGAKMCNEISRVFCCLAQIAGLQARVFCSHISGHMMNEVLVDGRWWWMDVMKGLYCFRDDGEPASAWDLFGDPLLFDRQSGRTWADFEFAAPFPPEMPGAREANAAFVQARLRECYFRPNEALAIGNHSVAEWRRFTYPWHTASRDIGRETIARRRMHRLMRRMGWPDAYFDPKLFDGALRTKD